MERKGDADTKRKTILENWISARGLNLMIPIGSKTLDKNNLLKYIQNGDARRSLARCLRVRSRKEMRSREVRPIVFKGGRDFGKVVGIRGAYRDSTGRWYVRKAMGGFDKQKPLDFGGKFPTFSVLERAAASAIKALEREIRGLEVSNEPAHPERSVKKTPIERGRDACAVWIEKTYTTEHFSKDTVYRRRKEGEGLAFVTRALLDHASEIDAYNTALVEKKFSAYAEKGSEVASVDCIRIIKAMFSSAIEQGHHFGANPAAYLCKVHRKRKDKPDERSISREQSAMVQAYIPVWCRNHDIAPQLSEELFLFHYLLTIGMRPSSAILFTSDELKVSTGPRGKIYRYRVNNHKCDTYMPTSQLLIPAFAVRLQALPVHNKGRYKSSFSFTEEYLCEKLNQIIAEQLGEPRVKSLRKGFVTECMAQARTSPDFDSLDARRITHVITDVADKNYNCDKQSGSDKVMEWWNTTWFKFYEHYRNLPENDVRRAKLPKEPLARRVAFEDLSDLLGD